MKRLVLFASGSGTNVENIIRHFQNNKTIKVTQVLTNKKNAKVIDRCNILNISSLYFNKEDFYQSNFILNLLKEKADFIILAGFLWKIPQNIIDSFPNKIINIHPALLPKYGGKGMYGKYIHQAIVKNKETETGITIHFVNENYDEGAIIFQKSVKLSQKDTVNDVARKISILEMANFPRIIEEVVTREMSFKVSGKNQEISKK